MNILIFSKDRAMQLDLLLRSIKEYLELKCKIQVLYTYSDDKFKKGYNKLINDYSGINFILQKDFNEDVKQIISKFENQFCLFLCDDNVFINKLSFRNFNNLLGYYTTMPDIHSVSLRMHDKISYCYPAKKEIIKPEINYFEDYIIWNWKQAKDQHTCWGYPMAINTHIYKTKEIKRVIIHGDFQNVNQLEAHCNRNRWTHKHFMCALNKPIIFDVCNNEVKNNSTSGDLNNKWIDGFYIESIENIPENSCHGKVKFNIEEVND